MRLNCVLCLIIVPPFISTERETRQVPDPPNNYRNYPPMTAPDEEKLRNLYGVDTFKQHRGDFFNIGDLRQQNEALQQHDEHISPPFRNPSDEEIQQKIDQVRLQYLQQRQRRQKPSQHDFPFSSGDQRITQPVRSAADAAVKEPLAQLDIRRMLKELLERFDVMKQGHGQSQGQGVNLNAPPPQPPSDRCTLRGIWLSAVTGIGIKLEPLSDHEVRLHVVDLGKYTEHWEQEQDEGRGYYKRYISSDWSGRAVVSTESATTISIILQEKWTKRDREPKTAVFVGQCAICSGAPTIQGTWIMFPESQTCYEDISSRVPPRTDVMYLLK